jgi:hypothetical protein
MTAQNETRLEQLARPAAMRSTLRISRNRGNDRGRWSSLSQLRQPTTRPGARAWTLASASVPGSWSRPAGARARTTSAWTATTSGRAEMRHQETSARRAWPRGPLANEVMHRGRSLLVRYGPSRHEPSPRPPGSSIDLTRIPANRARNPLPKFPSSNREFAMDARLASLSDRIVSLERQLDALRAENARLRGVHGETGQARQVVERRAAGS